MHSIVNSIAFGCFSTLVMEWDHWMLAVVSKQFVVRRSRVLFLAWAWLVILSQKLQVIGGTLRAVSSDGDIELLIFVDVRNFGFQSTTFSYNDEICGASSRFTLDQNWFASVFVGIGLDVSSGGVGPSVWAPSQFAHLTLSKSCRLGCNPLRFKKVDRKLRSR